MMTNNYIKLQSENFHLEYENLFSKIKNTLPGIDIIPYPENDILRPWKFLPGIATIVNTEQNFIELIKLSHNKQQLFQINDELLDFWFRSQNFRADVYEETLKRESKILEYRIRDNYQLLSILELNSVPFDQDKFLKITNDTIDMSQRLELFIKILNNDNYICYTDWHKYL